MISRAAARAAVGDVVAWTMQDGATMAGTVTFVGYDSFDVRRVDGTVCRIGPDLTIWKASPDDVLDACEFFQHRGEVIPVGSQRILNTPQIDDDETGDRHTPAGSLVGVRVLHSSPVSLESPAAVETQAALLRLMETNPDAWHNLAEVSREFAFLALPVSCCGVVIAGRCQSCGKLFE